MNVIAYIIIGIIIWILFFDGKMGSFDASSALGGVWGFITKIFDIVIFFILGVITMPAMLVMAMWHPIWETWLKEFNDLGKKPHRIILLVPLSIVVGAAMIIMTLFHPHFETRVGKYFGKKPF